MIDFLSERKVRKGILLRTIRYNCRIN